MKIYWRVFILLVSYLAHGAAIKGKVVAASGGETLQRVQVLVLERKVSTITAEDGTFSISNLPPGKYTLQASAVGYRLANTPFEITGDQDNKEFSITLVPENLRRTEVVDVKGDVFQGENPAIPSQLTLTPEELKEASTVLANDPFRAIQALPGVSASQNDDFLGQFTVLGAPFDHVGVYVDDILLPQPFHTLPNFIEGASLSVFSTETLQELSLMEVAYPVRYADTTGAALAVTTREGGRTRPHFSISAGLADSEALGEGVLGRAGKGSWMVSGRKSYLNYLFHDSGGDPTTDVAFEDGDLKLNYDLTPKNNLSFYSLVGHTDVDHTQPNPDANTLNTGGNDLDMVRLGWRSAVDKNVVTDTYGAYIRERFDTHNLSKQILDTDYYGEWVGGTRFTWNWNKDNVLEAGYTGRRLRDSGFLNFVDTTNNAVALVSLSNNTGYQQDGFVQQSSSLFNKKLHLMAGLRWDQVGEVDFRPISPQASAAWQLGSHTQVQFGYGRYAEFPAFQSLAVPCGPPFPPDGIVGIVGTELLTRSNQYSVGIEQRFADNFRLRVEGFDRENRLVFGARDPAASTCSPIKPNAFFDQTSIPDNSRGMQIILQRRSANRLSGWIGYTLDYSRTIELLPDAQALTILSVPTATDQRHTVNAFAMYRLTPTINLSGKMIYGSGIPITDIQIQTPGGEPTGPGRDLLGPYERLDLRMDKAWAFERWKMTLYVEGLNLTNHNNPQFLSSSFDPATGHFVAITDKGLPVTPTAGVRFEF